MKIPGKTRRIISLLEATYPQAKIALNFSNHMQLLAATILSAQCTDKRVNMITKELFRKYRTINDFAAAKVQTLEQEVRSAGFFRHKAANIIAAAKMIQKDFRGRVPRTMPELRKLPGVARKTANVVLHNAFGAEEGIAVDTHVSRVSVRLGLSGEHAPDKIEQDLMRLIPKTRWGRFSDLLIAHGRKICKAAKPLCQDCGLSRYCDFFAKIKV